MNVLSTQHFKQDNKKLSANKNASFLDNLPFRGDVWGQHATG